MVLKRSLDVRFKDQVKRKYEGEMKRKMNIKSILNTKWFSDFYRRPHLNPLLEKRRGPYCEIRKPLWFDYINAFLSIFFIASFLFFYPALSSEQKIRKIEGIFYLDHTPVSIEIRDGKIYKINRKVSLDDPRNAGIYVSPGLIDNQVNGYASVSFVFAGEELTVEGVRKATHALWKEGVTTYLPTLTTQSHAMLIHNFAILAEAVKDDDIGRSIPGYHLEGPYISPVDGYRGAHPKQWVRLPDWEEFMEYREAADYRILQVLLAPEMEGAFEFIRHCHENGIIVGLAHHNASAEVIQRAVD